MLFFLALACQSNDVATVSVLNHSGSFFGRPWPSDNRMMDGHPDLTNFPNPSNNPLIDRFIEEMNKVDGFGNNAPIYFPLDGTPDLDKLPTEVDSLNEDVVVHLIDIDPNSPYRGERFPIRWHFQEEATNWQPAHLLSIAPTWGFPLRPSTTYAAVLTKDFVLSNLNFEEPSLSEKALFEVWEYLDYDIDDIGAVTIFTTQNPMKDLIAIAKRIDEEISTPWLNPEVEWAREGNGCTMYDGELLIPLWQYGEKPYANNGGGFAYDENGRPRVFDWELVNFRISVPNAAMPENGWPVAIYSHGTGGDYTTFASDAGALEPATQLAKAGMLGIGISQPLHADRGTGADPELYSFNYLNPTSARTMFRQGAADQIYMAKLLSSHPHEFQTEQGLVHIDPSQIHYIGHSHGGEVGALALPFMGEYIQSAVLSGAGGALSITLMERESGTGGINIQELLRNAIALADNEELNPFHPAIGLVQHLAEVTDPLNYSRYWYVDQGYWTQRPFSILMTEGLHDEYTPPKSIEILAASAHLPIVGTKHSINTAQEILNYPTTTKAQGNREGYNQSRLTSGLIQFPDDGHFPIFQNEAAANAYQHFFATTLTESHPIITVDN